MFDKKIYISNPIKSMSARFIYEVDELETNTIENYFEKIEGRVAPQIKELIDTINKFKNEEVQFHEIKTIVESMLPQLLIFYYRSGALLSEFASSEEKYKIPLMSKKILDKLYISRLSKMITNCYKFAILESTKGFLLSDQYISTVALKLKGNFANISNRHMGVIETLILIPISSKYYVAYWHSDKSFIAEKNSLKKLNENEESKINQAIINNSYVKCIGEDKEILALALTNYKWKSPSQIFIGRKAGGSYGYSRKKEVFFDEIDEKAYEFIAHSIPINQYVAAKRNDKCPCNSDKKYKKCHIYIIQLVERTLNLMSKNHQLACNIKSASIMEKPIDEWGT